MGAREPVARPRMANPYGEDGTEGSAATPGGGTEADERPSAVQICQTCRVRFDSAAALFGHTPRCLGVTAGVAAMPRDEVADPEWLRDEVDAIKKVYVEEQASLHYEDYVGPTSLERCRESTSRIMKLQSEAIKDAVHAHFEEGGAMETLDDVISTIMACVDPLVSTKRMEEAQTTTLWNSQQSYTVRPRRRVLPNGGVMYDLPIEETVQRQLYMDPLFAKYFTTDWGSLPRAPDGEYHDIQDGSVAKEHPELGKQDYRGPSRTGWGCYGDAIELTDPIGFARGRHKVDLYYSVCLNQPGYMRNELDYIFLIAVVLHKDQADDKVGAGQVINPQDGFTGTSFAASMRRLNRPNGVKFYVPAGVGGLSFEPRLFRGWLLLISADALAAAELLGTKGSFGPKVKCFCWMCNAGANVGYDQVGSFLPGRHSSHTERTQAVYDVQAGCLTQPASVSPPACTFLTYLLTYL